MLKKPWVCVFFLKLFYNVSNFVLKVFQCLLPVGTWESGLDKFSTEQFKDFPPPIAIFKDFQGVEFLFENSRTFKMLANPIQRYHLLTHLFEESEDPGTDKVKRWRTANYGYPERHEIQTRAGGQAK